MTDGEVRALPPGLYRLYHAEPAWYGGQEYVLAAVGRTTDGWRWYAACDGRLRAPQENPGLLPVRDFRDVGSCAWDLFGRAELVLAVTDSYDVYPG